jgi:hypothetical protein
MNNESPKRFLWVAASCMKGRVAGTSMALSPEPVGSRCPTIGFAQTTVPEVQIRNGRNAIRIRPTFPVAPVALDNMQSVQGKARPAANMRNCGDQRINLGDVVAVRTSQDDREWDALRVDDQVVLAAELAPVGRVRAGFFPRASRERTNRRQWRALGRAGRDDVARPAEFRGCVARHPPPATRPAVASRRYSSRSPSPAAAGSRRCLSAAQARWR